MSRTGTLAPLKQAIGVRDMQSDKYVDIRLEYSELSQISVCCSSICPKMSAVRD